jgi:hypothetical protein
LGDYKYSSITGSSGFRSSKTVVPQALRRFITPPLGVFGQAFFQKGCAETVAPVYHAVSRVFDKTFSQKVFGQAFFQKGCAETVAPVYHAG